MQCLQCFLPAASQQSSLPFQMWLLCLPPPRGLRGWQSILFFGWLAVIASDLVSSKRPASSSQRSSALEGKLFERGCFSVSAKRPREGSPTWRPEAPTCNRQAFKQGTLNDALVSELFSVGLKHVVVLLLPSRKWWVDVCLPATVTENPPFIVSIINGGLLSLCNECTI